LIVGAGSATVGNRIEAVATAAGGAIAIRGTAATGYGFISWHANAASTEYARIGTDNNSALIFGTGSSATEGMRLTSTGLGIGTSSISGRLDIANTGSDTNVFIKSDTTRLGQIVFNDGANQGLIRYDHSTDTMSLFSGGTQNLFLNSSGNLGLGVTPSAWTNFKAIQAGTGGAFASNNFGTGNIQTIFTSNAYYDSGAFKYIVATSDPASMLRIQNGVFQFNIAGAGTAGNTISFTQAMTLNASGQLETGIAGTAAAPSFTRTGDTNTGIFFPAADTIAFSEGGAEAMRIDSAGFVGIGTSSPVRKFHVNSGTANAVSVFESTDGTAYVQIVDPSGSGAIGTSGGNGLIFWLGDAVTEAMRINDVGNVGIGTSSPNASAILDAQSTTKGVRMPNMTTTQKNAISSPAAGLMVFDTTLAKLCVYSGSAWQTITSI
jgi:hypothetical protein